MGGNLEMKVKRSDSVVWRVIDGEIVILAPEGASINALTGCGSRIWELIEEEMSIGEIVQHICAEYEVGEARATRDITEFINELALLNLLEAPAYEGISR